MPEKKKQHYVPKLYLKFFSNFDKRTHVGLYNLRTNLYLKSASIDGQNQEDYFYGKNTKIENAFSDLENRIESIIREIIRTNSLPALDSEDYLCLLVYVMFQQNRTKLSALKIENLLNQVTQMIKNDKFVPTVELAEIHHQYEYPGIASLENISELIDAVLDLKCKLLINKTEHPFITSDHPVVKWNQFLNQRKYPNPRTGLATKGLMLLFPISPNIIIAYFDSDVYSLGDDNDSVDVLNENDVLILNLIQSYQCKELVFFNQVIDEVYIKDLLNEKTKINLLINALRLDYCNAKNTNLQLNELQKENLVMNHIGVLSFISDHPRINQLTLSKPNDYIRSGARITT
jgi:hypothetical protein